MKKRLNYPDALPQQRRASFFIQKGDEYMSNQTNPETRQWGSRFGYLMVAAGAAIGLGNIWRFPYLAYEGGGGVFLVVYIIMLLVTLLEYYASCIKTDKQDPPGPPKHP